MMTPETCFRIALIEQRQLHHEAAQQRLSTMARDQAKARGPMRRALAIAAESIVLRIHDIWTT